VPSAYNVLASGTPEQIERYLRPALRGELHDAYAVTEEHAGSDPSRIATIATRVDGGWRIDGEKWFVTYGDIAAVYIVMAKLFVSEAANRCADRALQIFGGRGYIRTNVAERFWRELRVDRIWEGTSEIQRLIIARALERRGVERMLW
jgi:alkylation response protein AidB-like acyl-CoA dehydrogenase